MNTNIGKKVLIRGNRSGVEFGELVSQNGSEVTLKNARRIWYWDGAATADYKLYKHVRLCRKRLLRQRYEDYAWLLFQLEKDTEVFNLTHNTRDWTFEDWRKFYLKKAKEDKQ